MTQDSLIFGKIYTLLGHSNIVLYKLLYNAKDEKYYIIFRGKILKIFKYYKPFEKEVNKLIKNRQLHEQN
jgi:hypothetical protein